MCGSVVGVIDMIESFHIGKGKKITMNLFEITATSNEAAKNLVRAIKAGRFLIGVDVAELKENAVVNSDLKLVITRREIFGQVQDG